MLLNIRDILHNPGTIPFEFELPLDESDFLSVRRWNSSLIVAGTLRNSADVLTLKCEVTSDAVMICDRCGKEYDEKKTQYFEATLSDELIDEDSGDIFPISGNVVDLGEIVRTLFILEEPSLNLCSDNCEFGGADYE